MRSRQSFLMFLIVIFAATGGVLAGNDRSEKRYMEVWPLVLTSEEFRLRVPTARKSPEELKLRVELSQHGTVVRTENVRAIWENIKWPDEVWSEAGLPEDEKPRGGWIAQMPIAPTSPGTYRFRARVTDPGAMSGVTFVDPVVTVHERPDWLDAEAGKQGLKQVPRPWTPVEVNTRDSLPVLSCWNRRTVLGDNQPIQQIISGGRELLTSPIRLIATDAAGSQLRPQGDWDIATKEQTRVCASRRWGSHGAHVDVTITHEYDGLTWLEMAVGGPTGISKLELELPVDRDLAPLTYYFPDIPWYWGNINNVVRTPGRVSVGAQRGGAGSGWAAWMPACFAGSQTEKMCLILMIPMPSALRPTLTGIRL